MREGFDFFSGPRFFQVSKFSGFSRFKKVFKKRSSHV